MERREGHNSLLSKTKIMRRDTCMVATLMFPDHYAANIKRAVNLDTSKLIG
jgi:hypothetical protein